MLTEEFVVVLSSWFFCLSCMARPSSQWPAQAALTEKSWTENNNKFFCQHLTVPLSCEKKVNFRSFFCILNQFWRIVLGNHKNQIIFCNFELIWEKLSHKNAIKSVWGSFLGRKKLGRFLAPFDTKKGVFQIQPISNTDVYLIDSVGERRVRPGCLDY